MKQSRTLGLLLLLILTLGVLWGSLSGALHSVFREALYPFENLVLHGREWIGRPFDFMASSRIVEENTRLDRENERLRRGLTRLEALERENRRLRSLLGMAEKLPGRFVPARVLSRGGSGGWWKRLRVAGGTKDGIAVGQAVCGPEGLVGKIVSAAESSADVLLIIDPNSRVAGRFEPPLPGGRGVVFGGGATPVDDPALRMLYTVEPLVLRYFDRDTEVPENRLVVTSGLGGVYPANIPVGRVINASRASNDLYGEARVAPFEVPSDLSHVLVLVEGEWP